MKKDSFLSIWYMSSIILVISIATLIIAKSLLIPLVLGIFLSLTLAPLVAWLVEKKFPKILAIITTFIVAFISIGILGSVVGFAINEFADKVPEYAVNIQSNIATTKNTLLQTFSISEEQLLEQFNIDTISSWGLKTAGSIATTAGTVAASLGLTIVITFLLLLYRDRIKKFFSMIASKNQQEEIQVIARKSFSILPRYLSGLLFVIGIMSILNSVGFWLIGVPSPLFWGIMVGLLNVIPYVGPAIGFGSVTLFSLVVVGPNIALMAIGMFLIIQFVDNNFLTPVVAGGQIDINPLAAIISIVIWGMLWGVVGMILALPILGLIKIICDTIPELQAIGYLLGSKN